MALTLTENNAVEWFDFRINATYLVSRIDSNIKLIESEGNRSPIEQHTVVEEASEKLEGGIEPSRIMCETSKRVSREFAEKQETCV